MKDFDRQSLAEGGPSDAARPQRTHAPADPHDEWGVYDPDCAGLPAILARIGAGLDPDDYVARRRQAHLLRLSFDEDE